MLRKSNPLAPSGLTDAHRRAICQHPEILQFRQEKRDLIEEMRSLAGSVKKPNGPFLNFMQATKLSRRTPLNLENSWQVTPKSQTESNISKLHPCLKSTDRSSSFLVSLILNIAMLTIPRLCEPSRRDNRVSWDLDDDDDILLEKSEEPSPPARETIECPIDVCIVCCSLSRRSASNPPHKFWAKRTDSLRRHHIDSHHVHTYSGINYTWAACHHIPKFTEVTKFLAHAAQVHKYDINTKLHHHPVPPHRAISIPRVYLFMQFFRYPIIPLSSTIWMPVEYIRNSKKSPVVLDIMDLVINTYFYSQRSIFSVHSH